MPFIQAVFRLSGKMLARLGSARTTWSVTSVAMTSIGRADT